MNLHAPTQSDLFGTDDSLIGLRVRLDRDVDRRQPCCANVAELAVGRGPHAYELLCAAFGSQPRWRPHAAVEFILEIIRTIGVPDEPLIYRDQSSPAIARRRRWEQRKRADTGVSSHGYE